MRSPGVAEAVIVLVETLLVEDVARDEIGRHEFRDQPVGQPGVGMVRLGTDHQEALLRELQDRWKMWDGMIQRESNGQPVSEEERRQERDKMVDVLNRRNYIRNLVRDVNEALES